MNPNGITHGAVLFTLMDTAMGSAVMSVLPEGHLCATIELQTRFHRGASDGVIRATAWITSQSRRIVHLAAETVDPDGQILASATSSFAVIPPRSEPGG